MPTPARILTSLIYPSASARPVVKAHVDGLALSFKAIGLQTPITVKPCRQYASGRQIDAFEIVAGHHRYAAAVALNWPEIDAVVAEMDGDDAELWEIDENFARAELTDAQRADHHVRRERILKAKGLVSAGPGRPPKSEQNARIKSYSEQAASALGLHEATVRRDLRRGKGIENDALAIVAGTDVDNGRGLDELLRTPRDQQADKAREMVERSCVKQLRPAPDPLNDPEAHERQLAALMSAWNRAAAVVREEFFLRIDRPVFDNSNSGRAA